MNEVVADGINLETLGCRNRPFVNLLLSIITINRNNADGLIKTISSFDRLRHVAQVEFLLIDGKSDDGSILLARKFYHPFEIVSEPDLGIYDAMNKGAKLAKGKFLLWINSGDRIHDDLDVPGMLASLDAEYAETDVVACRVAVHKGPESSQEYVYSADPNKLPFIMFPHQGMIFARKRVIEMGGYNTQFKLCADRDLLVRVYLAHGQIVADDRVLADYYLDGVSSMTDLYLENLSVDRENKLITTWVYMRKTLRYRLGGVRRRVKVLFDALVLGRVR